MSPRNLAVNRPNTVRTMAVVIGLTFFGTMALAFSAIMVFGI